MIADPIKRPISDNLRNCDGQFVFVISENLLRYTKPLIINGSLVTYDSRWAIRTASIRTAGRLGGFRYYSISGRIIDRAEFVGHLSEHHPDHLEWLLFHPEWL